MEQLALLNFSECGYIASRKKEFQHYIENEFKPILESAKSSNEFDWVHLKIFYNKSKKQLLRIYNLRIFCEFTFKLFFTFNCEDDEFVLKIIQIHQQVISEYSELNLCVSCKGHFDVSPKHYIKEEGKSSKNILMSVNRLSLNVFDFDNRDYYSQLSVMSIYAGDYVFMKFLVKYGLTYRTDDLLLQARLELERLFNNYALLKELEGWPIEMAYKRAHFVESVMKRLFTDMKYLNLMRLNLVILGVDISLCMLSGDIYCADYSTCLNLYASTLPEPAISMKDVNHFLNSACPDDEEFVTDICCAFKSVFPDTPSLPSPRPLKYLCRCKVRDCIKKGPSTVTVLSDLHIPTAVKEYVLYMST